MARISPSSTSGPRTLTPIVFAEPDAIEVGDWVIAAAGSPFGSSHTITAGIVSAVGRGDMGIADYEEFIQTDAAINPGNSGGPLVNLRGELVGINTAIASRSGSSAGIGFSIPVRMVRFAMKSLIDSGHVDRGVIGVGVVDVDAATARERGQEAGVLVVETTPAGPAARAGIRAGDVILRFAGEPVEDSNRFRNRVAMTEPGAQVPVILIRDGRREKISLTIGQRGA
ncbi:MAG: PDZ domain-containing protein [Planctomycetota bacterium]